MSGQTLPVPPGAPSITIRRAKPEDAPVCGRVCFDAFYNEPAGAYLPSILF
jgi:hypothetical protein